MLWLAIAALLLAALAVNFSWIHGLHDADTLLLPLISIDRYTPFYWGDNRYGMLVPLLVSPVKDYRANLLLQTQILTAAAIACVVLLHMRILDSGPRLRALSISAGAVALAIAILQPGPRPIQAVLLAHPYFISLFFVLIAVVLMIRSPATHTVARYTAALLALLLGFWINRSYAPVAALLLLFLPTTGPRRDRWTALLLAALAFAAVEVYASRWPAIAAPRLAPAEFPGNVYGMLSNLLADHVYGRRLLMLLVALIAAAAWRGGVIAAMRSARAPWAVLAAGALYALMIAVTDWPARNLYEARYWTMPVAMLIVVASAGLLGILYDALARRNEAIASTLFPLALIATTLNGFGIPSVTRATAALESRTASAAALIDRFGCTHMVGNYALAWPAVFHSRMHHRQPGLWAITPRSEVTMDLWSKMPESERRYCGLCGDPINPLIVRHFALPDLQEAARDRGVCLFNPAPKSAASGATQ